MDIYSDILQTLGLDPSKGGSRFLKLLFIWVGVVGLTTFTVFQWSIRSFSPETVKISYGDAVSLYSPNVASITLNRLATGSEEFRLMKDAPEWDIFAMLGFPQARVVYELKVPLIKNDQAPYAVGILRLPEMISIGFISEKMDMEAGKASRSSRGGAPPGGMGGGPGRPGGVHGPQSITPINFWLKVHLSEKPSATHAQSK